MKKKYSIKSRLDEKYLPKWNLKKPQPKYIEQFLKDLNDGDLNTNPWSAIEIMVAAAEEQNQGEIRRNGAVKNIRDVLDMDQMVTKNLKGANTYDKLARLKWTEIEKKLHSDNQSQLWTQEFLDAKDKESSTLNNKLKINGSTKPVDDSALITKWYGWEWGENGKKVVSDGTYYSKKELDELAIYEIFFTSIGKFDNLDNLKNILQSNDTGLKLAREVFNIYNERNPKHEWLLFDTQNNQYKRFSQQYTNINWDHYFKFANVNYEKIKQIADVSSGDSIDVVNKTRNQNAMQKYKEFIFGDELIGDKPSDFDYIIYFLTDLEATWNPPSFLQQKINEMKNPYKWNLLVDFCHKVGVNIPVMKQLMPKARRYRWEYKKSENKTIIKSLANVKWPLLKKYINERMEELGYPKIYDDLNEYLEIELEIWDDNNTLEYSEDVDEKSWAPEKEADFEEGEFNELSGEKNTLVISEVDKNAIQRDINKTPDSDIYLGKIGFQVPNGFIKDFRTKIYQSLLFEAGTTKLTNDKLSLDLATLEGVQFALLMKLFYDWTAKGKSARMGPFTERLCEILLGGKSLNKGFKSNFEFADIILGNNTFISVKFTSASLSGAAIKSSAWKSMRNNEHFFKVYQKRNNFKDNFVINQGVFWYQGYTTSNKIDFNLSFIPIDMENNTSNSGYLTKDALLQYTLVKTVTVTIPSAADILTSYNNLSGKNLKPQDYIALRDITNTSKFNLGNSDLEIMEVLKNDLLLMREKGLEISNQIGDELVNKSLELSTEDWEKYLDNFKKINQKLKYIKTNLTSSLKETSYRLVDHLYEGREKLQLGSWDFRFSNFISKKLEDKKLALTDDLTGFREFHIDYTEAFGNLQKVYTPKQEQLIKESLSLLLILGSVSMDNQSQRIYDESENLARTIFGGENSNAAIAINDNSIFCDICFLKQQKPAFYSVKFNISHTKQNVTKPQFRIFSKLVTNNYLCLGEGNEQEIRLGWIRFVPGENGNLNIYINQKDCIAKDMKIYNLGTETNKELIDEYNANSVQGDENLKLTIKPLNFDGIIKPWLESKKLLNVTLEDMVGDVKLSVLNKKILPSNVLHTISGSFEKTLEDIIDILNVRKNNKTDIKNVNDFLTKVQTYLNDPTPRNFNLI